LSKWQEKILLLEWCRAIIKSCRADFSSNRNSSSSPCPPSKSRFIKNIFFKMVGDHSKAYDYDSYDFYGSKYPILMFYESIFYSIVFFESFSMNLWLLLPDFRAATFRRSPFERNFGQFVKVEVQSFDQISVTTVRQMLRLVWNKIDNLSAYY
jgi:hypothetical protein